MPLNRQRFTEELELAVGTVRSLIIFLNPEHEALTVKVMQAWRLPDLSCVCVVLQTDRTSSVLSQLLCLLASGPFLAPLRKLLDCKVLVTILDSLHFQVSHLGPPNLLTFSLHRNPPSAHNAGSASENKHGCKHHRQPSCNDPPLQ